jgi:hypothetical protein
MTDEQHREVYDKSLGKRTPEKRREDYDKGLGALTDEQRREIYDKTLGKRTSEQRREDGGAIALMAQLTYVKVGYNRWELIEGELPPPIYCHSSRTLPKELLGLGFKNNKDYSNICKNVHLTAPHVKGYVFKRATQEEINAYSSM